VDHRLNAGNRIYVQSSDTVGSMIDTDTNLVLVSLFELGRADRPATVERLARQLGRSEAVIRASLERLAQQGLADPVRVRLTMLGLAAAVSRAQARSSAVRAA